MIKIYFSYADLGQRSIRKINLDTKRITPVLDDVYTDYRDPFISEDGMQLYYSSVITADLISTEEISSTKRTSS